MKDFDLNLLKVFDALLETGSVTGAAQRLHLSVPATSRALGRLRRTVGDPVFVRAGRGLVPTPYALRAAPRLRAVLLAADAVVTSGPELDPATLDRSFQIRINDGVAASLAARLMRRVGESAPAVRIRFVAEDEETVEPLRDGTLDLDVGNNPAPSPDLRAEVLYEEGVVAVARADSALGRRRRPTLRQICAVPHVVSSRRGVLHGPFDEAIAERGLTRRVAAVATSFPVAALMAAQGEFVAFVPGRFAADCSAQLGLRVLPLPVRLPRLEISQVWHARLDSDPVQRWLRAQLRAAAADDLRR